MNKLKFLLDDSFNVNDAHSQQFITEITAAFENKDEKTFLSITSEIRNLVLSLTPNQKKFHTNFIETLKQMPEHCVLGLIKLLSHSGEEAYEVNSALNPNNVLFLFVRNLAERNHDFIVSMQENNTIFQ